MSIDPFYQVEAYFDFKDLVSEDDIEDFCLQVEEVGPVFRRGSLFTMIMVYEEGDFDGEPDHTSALQGLFQAHTDVIRTARIYHSRVRELGYKELLPEGEWHVSMDGMPVSP